VFPAGLYALVDDGVLPELSLVDQARALLSAGVEVLQLRVKQMPLRTWAAQARDVVHACESAGAVCLVNDRVDVALVSGAHGVHLGEEDLSPEDARRVLPPHARIGVTVRDLAGAVAAERAGADYVGVGPVFETRTKQVHAPVLGVARLADLVRECPLPVVAIGGIGLANISQVASAGVHSAAVLSDLLCAPDIPEQARRLGAAFWQGRAG
jgi:thiamine-phosphate pyrophosphorylase